MQAALSNVAERRDQDRKLLNNVGVEAQKLKIQLQLEAQQRRALESDHQQWLTQLRDGLIASGEEAGSRIAQVCPCVRFVTPTGRLSGTTGHTYINNGLVLLLCTGMLMHGRYLCCYFLHFFCLPIAYCLWCIPGLQALSRVEEATAATRVEAQRAVDEQRGQLLAELERRAVELRTVESSLTAAVSTSLLRVDVCLIPQSERPFVHAYVRALFALLLLLVWYVCSLMDGGVCDAGARRGRPTGRQDCHATKCGRGKRAKIGCTLQHY